MTRKTDNAHEIAESLSIEPRLKRLPVLVDENEQAAIRNAIVLKLATQGELRVDDPIMRGSALAAICGEWMTNRIESLAMKREP